MFNPFFHPLRQCLLNYVFEANVAPLLFSNLQICSFDITPGVSFVDVTIAEVDPSVAVLFWSGWRATLDSGFASPRAYFTSSTNVRISRGGVLAGLNTYGRFFVVELPSSQVNSIQHLDIQIDPDEAFFYYTITGINLVKSIILYCGCSCDLDIININQTFVEFHFLNSTTVRAARCGYGAGATSFSNAIVLECK